MTKRITVSLPDEIWEQINENCSMRKETVSGLIQVLFTKYLSEIGDEPFRKVVFNQFREVSKDLKDIKHHFGIPDRAPASDITLPESEPIPPSPYQVYPDPVGLSVRLDQWLVNHQMTTRSFRDKFGVNIGNKAKWRKGAPLTYETASRILSIIGDDQDQ